MKRSSWTTSIVDVDLTDFAGATALDLAPMGMGPRANPGAAPAG